MLEYAQKGGGDDDETDDAAVRSVGSRARAGARSAGRDRWWAVSVGVPKPTRSAPQERSSGRCGSAMDSPGGKGARSEWEGHTTRSLDRVRVAIPWARSGSRA